MNNQVDSIRQGDLEMVRIDDLPEELPPVGPMALARGSTSHHAHEVVGAMLQVETLEAHGRVIVTEPEVRVTGDTTRHGVLHVRPGVFEYKLPRAWLHGASLRSED